MLFEVNLNCEVKVKVNIFILFVDEVFFIVTMQVGAKRLWNDTETSGLLALFCRITLLFLICYCWSENVLGFIDEGTTRLANLVILYRGIGGLGNIMRYLWDRLFPDDSSDEESDEDLD